MKRRNRELEDWLRNAVPANPPDDLKDSILSRADDTPQESVTRSVPRRRTTYWKLAASFAMMALICSIAVSRLAESGYGKDLSRDFEPNECSSWVADVYFTELDRTAISDPMPSAPDKVEGLEEDSSLEISAPACGESSNFPNPVPGLLTAGEWCDNLDFSFFSSVLQRQEWSEYPERYQLTIARRIAVTVSNAHDQPLSNASVIWTGTNGQDVFRAVTDVSGQAYLFALSEESAQGGTVTVLLNGAEQSVTVSDGEDALHFVMDAAANTADTLDLMFVIDTTGSMADELSYLQAELEDVIRSVSAAHSNTRIRLSVNFYRDEGDDYVVLPFDFTEDISEGLANLSAQSAQGGGDNPEAVDVALDNALNGHDWTNGSVRLCYLVCDAPPHSNQASVVHRLQQLLPAFAANGIRLIPVASSGVDTETECFLRMAATLTGGTYTFLTNDSGIGNDHLEPTVGDYQVQPLNTLLTEITSRYLG